uniref:Uncharacterized protein n=1 Tax=Rhizophagus irregularis (strain DAOM 181602 / DAOM 197198 / MUCL 43194) TaxID=747089 RepID=U9U811_RHIID
MSGLPEENDTQYGRLLAVLKRGKTHITMLASTCCLFYSLLVHCGLLALTKSTKHFTSVSYVSQIFYTNIFHLFC